ncbi:MAG: DnaJ domain-containing protein [Myxococcales bacterium]|nr:DnaJ domain-containing protein [Myxococcales bacterium]
MDTASLQQWLSVLDSLSYYDLFRVPPTATFDEVRVAFHAFADTFHPDGHTWRHPWEQQAIGRIFRRGTEAYRVLTDPLMRPRYDDALRNGIVRPENIVVELERPSPQSRPSIGPGAPLVDRLKNPAARQFVLRAQELHKKGDPKQAKIQLVLAMHMDAKNPALEEFSKTLDEAIKAKADEQQKSWKKP